MYILMRCMEHPCFTTRENGKRKNVGRISEARQGSGGCSGCRVCGAALYLHQAGSHCNHKITY